MTGQLLVWGVIGSAIVLSYFSVIWFFYGRDPESRPIVVQYEPPDRVSSAVARFMYIKNADYISLGALIVQIASKGFWSIQVKGDGYDLQRQQKSEAQCRLSAEEMLVVDTMLEGQRTVHVNSDYSKIVETALSDLKRKLEKDRGLYFLDNRLAFRYGVAIAILVSLLMWPSSGLWLVSSEAVVASIVQLIIIWFAVNRNSHLKNFSIDKYSWLKRLIASVNPFEKNLNLFEVIMELPMRRALMVVRQSFRLVTIFLIGSVILVTIFGTVQLLFSAVNIMICFFFFSALPKRTEMGARLFEVIEGLRTYMVVAEEARAEFHDAPEFTSAKFEQLLPFAMALEIEANWSNQLSATLKHAGYDPALDESA